MHATGSVEQLEAEFDALADEFCHTADEPLLASALERVPAPLLASRPFFLVLQGDLHFEARQDALAEELYRRALDLEPDPARRLALQVRAFAAAVRLGDTAEQARLKKVLEPVAGTLPPRERAQWCYWRGTLLWRQGQAEQAIAAFEELCEAPGVPGDRRLAFTRFRAHYALSAAAVDLGRIALALSHTRALIDLGRAEGFYPHMLLAFVLRFNALLLDEGEPPSLDELLAVPFEALAPLSASARHDYLTAFGVRALRLGNLELAASTFRQLELDAERDALGHRLALARFWLMQVGVRQGALDEARRWYEALQAVPAPHRFKANLQPVWAALMIRAKRPEEALSLLADPEAPGLAESDRARLSLYRLAARDAAGEPGARAQLEAWLATEEGEAAGRQEALLLAELGVVPVTHRLLLCAFGETRLAAGDRVVDFPRKKALSLIAWLALEPEGLSSEQLVLRLFADSEEADPAQALRLCVYQARRALKAAGLSDPIESLRGAYRLRREAFGVIDFQECERLHGQALLLEAAGHREAALCFHRLVDWTVRGPLFDDLPDPAFEPHRARFAAMAERSRAFIRAHALALETGPSEPHAPVAVAEALTQGGLAGALAAWQAGEGAEARAILEGALRKPFLGDRTAIATHGAALGLLSLVASTNDRTEARLWADRLALHARRHPEACEPLFVHAVGVHAGDATLAGALAIAPEALTSASPETLSLFLASLARLLGQAGRDDLAGALRARLDHLLSITAHPAVARSLIPPSSQAAKPDVALRLRFFGEPSVRVGAREVHFPRRKGLYFLGLLALWPQGLKNEEVFAALYPETRHSSPKATVYKVAQLARRFLAEAGLDAEVIESVRGLYRLHRAIISHCDLHCFDAFYDKGRELERLGHAAIAAHFYRVAADVAAPGVPFDGFDEPCFETAWRSYRAKAFHAARFLAL